MLQIGLVHAYLRAKHAFRGSASGPVMFDPGEVCRLLIAAYGHMIFVDGVFGADPHPGNLLLLPDGRLGLIDFGMTKELTTTERRLLARSLVAVHDDDEEAMLEVAHDAQLRSKHMRRATLVYAIKFAWGRYADGGGDEAEAVYKSDPIVQSGDGASLMLVRRVVFMLRGMSQVLGAPADMVSIWYQQAKSALARIDGHEQTNCFTKCIERSGACRGCVPHG